MTTDEEILSEMIDRVTNPIKDNVENFAVQMFCMIVQSNNDLVIKAHELIVKKLYSSNKTEAIRAVELLEECMSRGGLEFQKKTAKFAFLNKLVAIVLDKHSGTPVPLETKKRVMECLMLWTVEHPDKIKIQETYDSLKKQVNFALDSSSLKILGNDRSQRSSILGNDDALVARLLKQGGKENYKKVNLLIQHRVNQEARRSEFICHLKSELKKIESTVELLDEMLTSYIPSSPETDSRDIIKDLYNTCKGHNEQMARWPDFLGDSEPEFLEEVLNVKDVIMVAIQRYKEIFETEEQCSISTTLKTSNTDVDLLTELLGDTLDTSNKVTNPSTSNNAIKGNGTVDELNEIFGCITGKIDENKPNHPSDLLGNLDLLEPVNLYETETKDKPASTISSIGAANAKEDKKRQGFKELKEIDKLSEHLFKESLKDDPRLLSFKKETEKVTLNDMAKKKIQISPISSNTATIQIKPTSQFNDKHNTVEDLKKHEETFMKTSQYREKELKPSDNLKKTRTSNGPILPTVKPLADISVDLDEITPLDEGQRLLLDDDDIQMTLNFTADRPCEYVSTLVVTITNKSKLPVKDFQFEASVKKPCKLRLLPITDVVMAPKRAFRPSTPINQVILLLNPTQKPVDITCIVGYKLGDDPDLIKDSIIARDIPYV